MGRVVNFKQVPDSQDFSLIPIGRYPARLVVDAYQKDAQGAFMLDSRGEKAFRRTNSGEDKWNLEWHLLDARHRGRHIIDNLNFTPGGLKRVKVMYVRGGFATGNEESVELEPEEIDGTYWWIDVEHPDPADGLKQGDDLREAKYTFKANGCTCETCKKYDGQKVNVFAKVPFAGMEPMKAKDVVSFKGAPSKDGVCADCGAGKHFHKQGKDCSCEDETHPPF